MPHSFMRSTASAFFASILAFIEFSFLMSGKKPPEVRLSALKDSRKSARNPEE